MIVGLCGSGFPDVRRALQAALPDVELRGMDGAEATHVDVLAPLGGRVDAPLLDATAPRLVQQFGVGLQGVDLAAARQRGIPVANVPAAQTGNAAAVAEIVVLHLLALLRRYDDARRSIAQRRVGEPCGQTLVGKTVTVLGTGAVAIALIPRLAAFQTVVRVAGRRDYEDYPALAELIAPDRYVRSADLTVALRRSLVLVVCCPLTDETRGLVDRSALAAMPRGGWVINVGRGPIVDYGALHDALRSGHLSGAGLDVAWDEPIDPSEPLLAENLTITPHIGGVTAESYAAMAAAFADNVRRLASGEPIAHRVA